MKTKNSIQEEALEAILPHSRCTAVAGTGVGKTLLGLKHMSVKYYAPVRYLVVAPKLSVFEEWKAQAKEHGYEYLIPHIDFTTYLSISKMELEYDVVYLDECHNLLDSHRNWLEVYSGEILGLTGTPPVREYSEKGMMINDYCPVVYEYLVDDGIKDGILNDYQIMVHMLDVDTTKNIEVKTSNYIFFTSEKSSYDYWSDRVDIAKTPKSKQIASVMRMKVMQGFKSKEALAKKILDMVTDKCIIFANTKEQADRLCTHAYYSGKEESKENLELFKKGEIMKLSAVHQLSEGINIPNLKQGIIMHTFGGSSPKAKQKMGRLLRLAPKDKCTLHILCYRNTVDERWVQENLETLDQSKIFYI
jgi:superfamily II DNA or RNA helicase